MMARRMFDGAIRIDVSPAEAEIVQRALEIYAGDLGARSAWLDVEARDRRELADRVPRGRHANRRVAGELERDASLAHARMGQAMDMLRVLRPHVSASDAPSRSQPPTPSQTEE